PNPSVEREIIQQEIRNLQAYHQNIQEAINNAQHVQDSLIPPTSITHIQIPPPFYPTYTPIQNIQEALNARLNVRILDTVFSLSLSLLLGDSRKML
ncbi:hypothetical protein Tco_1288554, partial [Tanacetum coccineum]